MTCYYKGNRKAPLFAASFEDHAEVKREYAEQFRGHLRKRGGKICLLVANRPDAVTGGLAYKL